MPHGRAGSCDNAGTCQLRAPAEIDVLAVRTHLWIETPDSREQVDPREQAGARNGEDLADFVMLGLVELPFLDAGDRSSETIDAEADLQEAIGYLPVDQFRTDNGRVRPERLLDQ
jgi:hypothetical protein